MRFCCCYTAIQQEKGKQQLISGIENFDPAKLKHAETLEKNPLPTKEGSYICCIFSIYVFLFIRDNTSFIETTLFQQSTPRR